MLIKLYMKYDLSVFGFMDKFWTIPTANMMYTRSQDYTNTMIGKHEIQTFKIVVVMLLLLLLWCANPSLFLDKWFVQVYLNIISKPISQILVTTVNLKWLSYFEHLVETFLTNVKLVSVCGATPNSIPLKCKFPTKTSNRIIRHVYLRSYPKSNNTHRASSSTSWQLYLWLCIRKSLQQSIETQREENIIRTPLQFRCARIFLVT